MKNVFYFSHLNIIGGIEQFFAYLSEKYKDWDITIIYRTGDKTQINRLRRYVRVIKFNKEVIECDKAFYCFNYDIKPYIHAKQSALMLHGDYKRMIEQGSINGNDRIFTEPFDVYYGVSQLVCDSWKQLTGKDCTLVYNPYIKYPTKKLLKLVYCGRLTSEKGGDLINKLIERMDERCIDYQLFVYSNKTTIVGKNVFQLGTRLDASQFLNTDNYDYIIIPSKNEGYCYSLVQALSNGLPAICTPCPVFSELGVNSKNSITLEFDGSNIDSVIDDALDKTLKFKYTPKDDIWNTILEPGKSTYKFELCIVQAQRNYYDIDLEKHIEEGLIYEVSNTRAKLLIEKGLATLIKGVI